MKPCTAPASRAEVNAAGASKSNDAKKTDQVQNTPRLKQLNARGAGGD
jgi:hypothetical protein